MTTPQVQQPEETDAVFDQVNAELTRNVQAFLDNLPKHFARYSKMLEHTKSLNPAYHTRFRSGEPLSPLLARKTATELKQQFVNGGAEGAPPRLDPAGLKADPTAEEMLEEAVANQVPHGQQRVEDYLGNLTAVKSADDLPPIPEDALLLANMDILTAESFELRMVLSGVCEWIEMQMPPIKLEDNAGVAIQETVIRQLLHIRTVLQSLNERRRAYCDKVSEYASKYYKSPAAAKQWARSLILWNHDHWDQLERDWREMRQLVVLSGRVLAKNMEKLVTPRKQTAYGMHM